MTWLCRTGMALLGMMACPLMGCDPAYREQGTIRVEADPAALQDQILSPPGIARDPSPRKGRGRRVGTSPGTTGQAPSTAPKHL